METTTEGILADLVGFDTTSRGSNLKLVDYVRDGLAQHGVTAELIPNQAGDKANLWATLGPKVDGGLILSGHTDCVPVDGQDWTTDPFRLTRREGRLYGRGSADMKGFLASALAAVPDLLGLGLPVPIHLAFSYDEEVGCVGVRPMLDAVGLSGLRPAACIVGEPTLMQTIVAHKGGRGYRCTVTGQEAHSSLAPLAVNSIEQAAELIVYVRRLAADLARGERDPDYDVGHATISTASIEGGTAINIVPRHCCFTFEFRTLPGQDQDKVIRRIETYARDEIEPAMRAVAPAAGFRFEPLYDYPAHAIDPADPFVTRVKTVLRSNRHAKVAYGTEAGLFEQVIRVPTVVCGPGSIDVAHKPDESIEVSQLAACDRFIRDLAASMANA